MSRRRPSSAPTSAWGTCATSPHSPDERFAIETARKAIERGREALEQWDRAAAGEHARRALEALDEHDSEEDEAYALRHQALHVQYSALRASPERAREAVRRAVRLAEETGDERRVGELMSSLSGIDPDITLPEQEALLEHARAVFQRLAIPLRVAETWWHQAEAAFEAGQHDRAMEMIHRGLGVLEGEAGGLLGLLHLVLPAQNGCRAGS